ITRIPDEASVVHLLDAGFAAAGAEDSEGHVRLLTARSFWGHGFPTSTSPDRDPEAGARTATEGAEMALRLGRDDLAVGGLDGLQWNLQQLLRYQESYEASRRRAELARGAGDLYELGDALAMCAWNANYVGLFDEAKTIGRDAYELLVADAPFYAVHALSWAA